MHHTSTVLDSQAVYDFAPGSNPTAAGWVLEHRWGFSEPNVQQLAVSPGGKFFGIVSGLRSRPQKVSVYERNKLRVKWLRSWECRRCEIVFNSSDTLVAILLPYQIDICDNLTGHIVSVIQTPGLLIKKRMMFSEYTMCIDNQFYNTREYPARLMDDTIDDDSGDATRELIVLGVSHPPSARYAIVKRYGGIDANGYLIYHTYLMDISRGRIVGRFSYFERNKAHITHTRASFNEDNSLVVFGLPDNEDMYFYMFDVSKYFDSTHDGSVQSNNYADESTLIEMIHMYTMRIHLGRCPDVFEYPRVKSAAGGNFNEVSLSHNTLLNQRTLIVDEILLMNHDHYIVLLFPSAIQIWNISPVVHLDNDLVWQYNYNRDHNSFGMKDYCMVSMRFPTVMIATKRNRSITSFSALTDINVTMILEYWYRVSLFSFSDRSRARASSDARSSDGSGKSSDSERPVFTDFDDFTVAVMTEDESENSDISQNPHIPIRFPTDLIQVICSFV